MQLEDYIPAGEFCAHYKIEYSFISTLHEAGLIAMITQDGATLLSIEELPALEKFVRWHYELSINPEGIEALSHMLQRVELLLDENRTLRNRLRRFESGSPDATSADFADL